MLEEIEKFYHLPSPKCTRDEPEWIDATTGDTTCHDAIQTKSVSIEKSQILTDENKALHKDSVFSTSSLECDSFDDTKKVDSKVSSWEHIKALAEKRLLDPAISDFRLSIKSVDEFFDHFLSDDALHPLKLFHEDIIGDNNVTITKWEMDDSDDCSDEKKTLTRTLKFDHRSKLSVAQVTRFQTYRCYGSNACLRNVTKLKGIPSGETLVTTLSYFYNFVFVSRGVSWPDCQILRYRPESRCFLRGRCVVNSEYRRRRFNFER